MEVILGILTFYWIYRAGKKAYVENKKKIEYFNNSDYKKNANIEYFEMLYNNGSRGEYILYKFLDKNILFDKKIINNVYLEKRNGKTTEIDMILLCRKGIFVFEVKNYNGWIFGDRKGMYWTQRFETGKSFRFYNPILQNESHIKELKEYLNISNKEIVKSIVIFIGNGELKTNIEYVKNNYVINNITTAKDIIELNDDVLAEERIKDMYEKLIVKSRKTREFKKEHIKRIQKGT